MRSAPRGSSWRGAGAAEVFRISGATGAGVERLMDAVLGYLPDRTTTETKGSEVEAVDEDKPDAWSPF